MREGQGILYDSKNNEIYVGSWHNNLHHGIGRILNIKARTLNKPYDYTDFNQLADYWLTYEGEFKYGKMWG